MKREIIARHLQHVLLFRDATAAELDSFSAVARVQTIAESQYVYHQDDASEVFFVIANGEAELVLGRSDGIPEETSAADDVILFKDKFASAIQLRRLAKRKDDDVRASKTAQKTQAAIDRFAKNSAPYLLTGEAGTGKTIIARQIHLESSRAGGQYREVDPREFDGIVECYPPGGYAG